MSDRKSPFAGHTPGPWDVSERLSGSENHRGFYIIGRGEGWAHVEVRPGDEDGNLGRANAALIAAAPTLLRQREELREALRKIASGSPPDDWEHYDPVFGYSGYGSHGDANYVDEVDESNSGDVHSHGFSVGLWSAAKIARAALANLDEGEEGT